MSRSKMREFLPAVFIGTPVGIVILVVWNFLQRVSQDTINTAVLLVAGAIALMIVLLGVARVFEARKTQPPSSTYVDRRQVVLDGKPLQGGDIMKRENQGW